MNGKPLLVIIAIALVLATPFTALARMSSIDDADLKEVTARTGVTINLTFHIIDSYIAWTDDDGYAAAGLNNQGALTMSGFKIDSNGLGGDLNLTGLTYDIGTGAGSWLAIGLPSFSGWITCTSFKIGTGENVGGGLGSVVIGDLHTTANSAIKIRPH
jgi:hypothetical protein